MQIKKLFPFIILGLLSIGAAIFSFIFLWSLDVDSKTAAEQFASTINLAIPSSIALIALVWFGAGLDYGLSRIQKKSLRILASVLVYLFLPAMCCLVFPALVILLISGPFTEDWNSSSGVLAGILGTIVFIPAVLGFFFIYIGAGTNAFSRWLMGRLWKEPETG